MGVIAEGIVAYIQPLIDQTDGSTEQLNKAFAIGQLCYNLALLPEEGREASFREMRSTLQMSEAEFDDFRSSLVMPMIQRHEEMFPRMHGGTFAGSAPSLVPASVRPNGAPSTEAYPGTDRYAPCPCKSGEKYKFCCGKKRP